MPIFHSDMAPKAIGPYSQAVGVDNLVFVSGQIPVDPATGVMPEGIEAQTRQSLENIKHILVAAGLDFSNVVKSTVFLVSMADFAGMNKIYAEYFSEPYPARAAFAVVELPKGAQVEIEVIASRTGK